MIFLIANQFFSDQNMITRWLFTWCYKNFAATHISSTRFFFLSGFDLLSSWCRLRLCICVLTLLWYMCVCLVYMLNASNAWQSKNTNDTGCLLFWWCAPLRCLYRSKCADAVCNEEKKKKKMLFGYVINYATAFECVVTQ